MSFFHVRDGRILEQREEWDRLSLLQQLGAMPAPATAGPGVSSSATPPGG